MTARKRASVDFLSGLPAATESLARDTACFLLSSSSKRRVSRRFLALILVATMRAAPNTSVTTTILPDDEWFRGETCVAVIGNACSTSARSFQKSPCGQMASRCGGALEAFERTTSISNPSIPIRRVPLPRKRTCPALTTTRSTRRCRSPSRATFANSSAVIRALPII